MKHIHTFESFLDESIQVISEKMDVSPELAKVKTPDELVKAVGSDFLIIQSKHRIGNEKQRGGEWPSMLIIRGLNTNKIKVSEVGYSVHLLDINTFARDWTGNSTNWTVDEIFSFFEFNKKRGNRIYTIDELPIHKQAKRIYDEWSSNEKEIDSLLGDSVEAPSNRSVMTSSYAVEGSGRSHGVRYLEFDANGRGYTYYWNVYSFEPSLTTGRSIARAGYERDQHVYRITKSVGSKLLKIAEKQVELMKDAKDLMSNYYKAEKIQPK